ncbi:mCG1040769 [Mus musculus]|nr:mCG1040769 [Mus musculus]
MQSSALNPLVSKTYIELLDFTLSFSARIACLILSVLPVLCLVQLQLGPSCILWN